MHIRVSQKHVFICLLLCSLFLTSYISVLNTNGIIPLAVNVSETFSISGSEEHSSMSGETNSVHFDYMSAASTSINFFGFSSTKNWQSLVTKTSLDILTAVISAQIVCLIYSSRLSEKTCTQFNSLKITVFLHKKDGMK